MHSNRETESTRRHTRRLSISHYEMESIHSHWRLNRLVTDKICDKHPQIDRISGYVSEGPVNGHVFNVIRFKSKSKTASKSQFPAAICSIRLNRALRSLLHFAKQTNGQRSRAWFWPVAHVILHSVLWTLGLLQQITATQFNSPDFTPVHSAHSYMDFLRFENWFMIYEQDHE